MAGHSTYAANAYLNWLRGTTMPSAPSDLYISLHNGDPGNDGTSGTDVTTQVRAAGRVAATFGAPANKRIENSDPVEFGQSENAVNITHFGVWDAATDGNFLGGRSLQAARSVAQGDPVAFLTGDLAVDIAPK